jgi:5'-deoxynucleotidase YfbR-like HD superfamily hydrolase
LAFGWNTRKAQLRKLYLLKTVSPFAPSPINPKQKKKKNLNKAIPQVDRFELVSQTIEYEKEYDAQKDLREFLHVRKGIKNDFVKKWVEDAMKERDAYWKSKGLVSIVDA